MSGHQTRTERALGRLVARTCLSPWSFNRPHRNQSTPNGAKGQELCDVLTVFGDSVIVFSDKEVRFQSDRPLDIAWRRWYQRAVLDSVQQLRGAERWLKRSPDRVFIDAACTVRLPLPISNHDTLDYHAIAVVSGIREASLQHWGDDRGSLMIAIGDDVPSIPEPFWLGDPAREQTFVHVFDEAVIDLVLGELDTICDFTRYLRSRASLLRSGKHLTIAGEEELLAVYLQHRYLGDDLVWRQFDQYTGVSFDVGFWDRLTSKPEFARKKVENQKSYLWDRIIEEFASGMKADRLVWTTGQYSQDELVLREMAAFDRVERRSLVRDLLDIINRSTGHPALFRTILNERRQMAIVLCAHNPFPGTPADEARESRRSRLETYCGLVALEMPRLRVILGLATEGGHQSGRSHDAGMVFPDRMGHDDRAELRAIQEETGWFTEPFKRMHHFIEQEYPTGPARKLQTSPSLLKRPLGWNKPCPCGSGKHMRFCCRRG